MSEIDVRLRPRPRGWARLPVLDPAQAAVVEAARHRDVIARGAPSSGRSAAGMAAPDSTTPVSTSAARGPWTAMRAIDSDRSSTRASKPAQRRASRPATRSRLPALGTTRYSSSPTR